MEPFEQIRRTQKKYGSLAISIAIFAGFPLILLSLQPIGKGLILGTLFSILNFVLMGETLPRRLGVSRKKATLLSGASILLRYALLAIPLAVSIKMPQFNLVATIFGLFMIQIVLMAEQVGRTIFPSTRKNLDY